MQLPEVSLIFTFISPPLAVFFLSHCFFVIHEGYWHYNMNHFKIETFK